MSKNETKQNKTIKRKKIEARVTGLVVGLSSTA